MKRNMRIMNSCWQHPVITSRMRTILVDWLIDVANDMKMQFDTLHRAVQVFDDYCALEPNILRDEIQLVGCSAMFLAAKFEEVTPMSVHDLIYMTEDSYRKEDIYKREGMVFRSLNFHLSQINVCIFLKHFASELEVTGKKICFAMYLSDLVLLKGGPFALFKYSLIAASILFVVRQCLDEDAVTAELWPSSFEKVTTYKLEDLLRSNCVDEIRKMHAGAEELMAHCDIRAIYKKYNTERYMHVSSTKVMNTITFNPNPFSPLKVSKVR